MKQISYLFIVFSAFIGKETVAQGLLESNLAVQKKSFNGQSDFKPLYYTYDGISVRCDSSGYCWYTEIPTTDNITKSVVQRIRTDSASFNPILRIFKNLVVSKIEHDKNEALADCQLLKRQNDTIVRAQSALYFKNNNLIIILDSTTAMNEKEKIFDSLSILSGDMYVLKAKLDDLNQELRSFSNLIKGHDYERYYTPLERVVSADDSLNMLFGRFERIYIELKLRVKEVDSLMKSYKNTWNRIVASVLPSNKSAKSKSQSDFTTLPLINSIPGIGYYNANISLFGQTSYEDTTSAFLIQYGGFTGAISTNRVINLNSVFNTETSTYGFFVKNFWGFDRTKDKLQQSQLGLNLDIFYLGKRIVVDTVQEKEGFQSSVFHLKVGAEYMVIRNLLSLYGNVNGLSAVTNTEKFEEKLSVKRKISGFLDFGIRMLINPSKELKLESNFKLYVDINFLVAGGDVRAINKSKDILIPNIRFGVRKSFKN